MGKITVVGLGAGGFEQLPVKIYEALTNAKEKVYTRTMDHPVIDSLKKRGVVFASFDSVYEEADEFAEVYERIVDRLVAEAKASGSILYAVPGHPMVAEKTVKLLLSHPDVETEVLGGQSFLDDLFAALKIDPIDGFQLIDATSFERDMLQYRNHLIFCQVYDAFIASEVKLILLEDLPHDYEIKIVHHAGTEGEEILTVPLEDLDRQMTLSNLTTVYVPPVPEELLHHTFPKLRSVIKKLRSPEGCPWDRKQTHGSLREYAIEEVYELIEAIDNNDDEGIIEELGDLLMHIMLHSQIGEDNGYFSIDDVIRGITEKMIHRHPHVFGETKVSSLEDIDKNWEELKKAEKGHERNSILDGVPPSLPALFKAYQLQKKAAKVGFDWDRAEEVWQKLEEEIGEVKEALAIENRDKVEDEFGDVLFVLANLARFYKINPETALSRANEKFIRRFNYIEERLKEAGKDWNDASLEEMDALWNEAKGKEGK